MAWYENETWGDPDRVEHIEAWLQEGHAEGIPFLHLAGRLALNEDQLLVWCDFHRELPEDDERMRSLFEAWLLNVWHLDGEPRTFVELPAQAGTIYGGEVHYTDADIPF